MGKSAGKQIFFNLIWGIIAGALNYLINFAITPIITQKLGIEAYGFISLGNTLTSYINIISVGINSFSARYIAVAYHNNKLEEANQFYSSVLGANLILSALVLVPGTLMITRLETLLSIPDVLVADVKVLFLLVLINYLIGLVGSVFTSVAFMKNKTNITYRIRGTSSVLYAVVVLGMFYGIGIKVYYVSIANFIAAAFVALAAYYYSKKLIPELKINPRHFSFEKIKTLTGAGIYNSINSLGGTLGSGLDLLITNLHLSNTVMGRIAVGSQLGGLLNMVITLISAVFQPKQLEAYSLNDKDSLVKYLKISMEFCGALSNVFWCCFLFLGIPFLQLWLPGENHREIFAISVIILIGNLIVSIVTPLYYVNTLTVKVKIVSLITVGCGLTNVLSMLVLLKFSSFNGAYIVVGTTAVLDLVALIVFPVTSKRYLALDNNPFWPVMIRHFFLSGMIAAVWYYCPFTITCTSWIDFLLSGVILGCVSLFICMLILIDRAYTKDILSLVSQKFFKRT